MGYFMNKEASSDEDEVLELKSLELPATTDE